MDPTRFDDLVGSLTKPASRRGALGVVVGGALALLDTAQGDAKRRHRHGKGTGSQHAAGGGNSACAQFCAKVFGANSPSTGQCTSDAARGKGVCATCGAATDPKTICCTRNRAGVCTSYAGATCCSGAQVCHNGRCCTPLSVCKNDQGVALCGDVPDGCGGIAQCGDCPTAGQVCTADHTCCTPPKCAEGQCGAVPDDVCGGTVQCGDCDTSQCLTCGADNTCVTVGDCQRGADVASLCVRNETCCPAGCRCDFDELTDAFQCFDLRVIRSVIPCQGDADCPLSASCDTFRGRCIPIDCGGHPEACPTGAGCLAGQCFAYCSA